MTKRLVSLSALAGAIVVLTLLPAPASAASPWWQVLTGSRPTNLWEPQNQVEEIKPPATPFFLLVEESFAGGFNSPPFFPEATAANVQTALEGVYGAGNVEVTGGPGGTAPLIITWIGAAAGKSMPPVEVGGYTDRTKILVPGGSGRLILTLTNLGDAPVDATSTPVTITDELPQGAVATGVEAFAGVQNKFGPVDCEVKTATFVSCSFEGTLPPYESIEVEIYANLVGSPPVQGAPGTVTVAGGNVPGRTAAQEIEVSPDPTPFGIERFSAQAEEEGGAPAIRAGSHPFQQTTTLQLNSGPASGSGPTHSGLRVVQPAIPRNLRFPLPAGLVGNAATMPECSMNDFFRRRNTVLNSCPDASAIGVTALSVIEPTNLGFLRSAFPVFNLPPVNGEPARFGFFAAGNPVIIDTAVDPDDRYRIVASVSNATQLAAFLSSTLTIWGTPGDPRHDGSRGWDCVYHVEDLGPCVRPPGLDETAFLRQPVSCDGPLDFDAEAEPWNTPLGSLVDRASFAAEELHGCNQVPFDPSIDVAPTSSLANTPSGLDFELTMPNAGLLDSEAIAEGQAKKVEVTLPEGVTINPSGGDGLVGCSPGDYARETAGSGAGEGCPEASKVGTVQVSTPLLDEEAHGAVYVAAPRDNPSGNLVALYMVAKIPERGIVIKQAGKVDADPRTGRLTTTFDDLPQLPFSAFKLHFREGGRAPLVMPPACGSFQTEARFVPWSAADPENPLPSEVVTKAASFTIDHGVDGGGCPSGGAPPFNPSLVAGTVNNAAGSYSPFDLRLTRDDGEQEFTSLSVKLPPGLLGKLAGVPFCPDSAIAAARARTGPDGGAEELASPSCPATSQIGHTLVGAGVGSVLTYVPGTLYLAGPYHGSPLSIAAITPAKVGPFDLGAIVIREALKIDPNTAQATVDAVASDPIPHMIQGIPVRARDIRVSVDRPEFMLNPTSCARSSTAATVLGAGLDFGTVGDDLLVTVTSTFQAAECANLGFKPRLALSLRGGAKRAGTPRLKAVVRPSKGNANIAGAQVTLPPSLFLEQAHIRTVCTRVQFRAGVGNGAECPKGSIYGRAQAASPLLGEPLVGPVYLRSSNNPLPDLVVALHSKKADINLVGRIDTGKGGGLRTTFAKVPDAPVTKFVLRMQGGSKGLITNSTDLCQGKLRALAEFRGQNGKQRTWRPVVRAQCGKKKGKG